jgi:hypothetical protein
VATSLNKLVEAEWVAHLATDGAVIATGATVRGVSDESSAQTYPCIVVEASPAVAEFGQGGPLWLVPVVLHSLTSTDVDKSRAALAALAGAVEAFVGTVILGTVTLAPSGVTCRGYVQTGGQSITDDTAVNHQAWQVDCHVQQ